MNRRRILAGLLLSLVALLTPAAQAPAKAPRIGFLTLLSSTESPHLLEAFRQGLREW